ncbi:MAG: RNase adapter RapZ [Betaproteobacteria bacterium]|jgi:Predicted P-loop-containing kinase|nr:RNase adapter RapZ [Betaproteobacteria bacterium]
MTEGSAKVILISGLSGSGKSVALRALEDSGFFAMDNLPLPFLVYVVQELVARGETRIALTLDVRGGDALTRLPEAMRVLRDNQMDIRLLFLETSDQDLIRRFSETRRPHPLARHHHAIAECIALERHMLAGVADMAQRMDTTHIMPNILRAWVRELVKLDPAQLTLFFQSFGFKHGVPLDADFVFDVRCIPNPFYDPHLRMLTGKDKAVIDFLDAQTSAKRMFDEVCGLLERWLPDFIRDNRSALTVALGCTGGQHRSVYLAEALARHFEVRQSTRVIHRELS